MSRLSLRRTGSRGYRAYLRTREWNWRRQRWFRDCRARGHEPACQVCFARLNEVGSLDLHHASYEGVTQLPDGSWKANEKDEDLWPLCREHHQALHRRMDSGKDFYGWDRTKATVAIVVALRRERNEAKGA